MTRVAPVGPSYPYLETLNPEQRQAVETLEGPLLVLAGAGTGKTRVLTTRLAHLLATRSAYPSQLFAVTFTNKAAREMKERLFALIGPEAEGLPWLGTFHAIGVKLLRRHGGLVQLGDHFTILDTDDQIRLLKQLLSAHGIDEKRWPARQLAYLIDGWKNRGLFVDRVPKHEGDFFAHGQGIALYGAYQDRLKSLNAVDFGDLLLETLRLFLENPDVLATYQDRFRFLMVDEYQDTNVCQYLLLRLLAQSHGNLCCVGDDDQSIYSWRGAEVDNILRFEKDFPRAKVIRLEQNYRSTPHILGVASAVIAHNENRFGKTLRTQSTGGAKVLVRGHWDGEDEARSLGDDIERLHQEGHRYSDMAILVRASFQMRAFEDRFLTIGLPYRVIGGARFYERQEIRDALAYFRLLVTPDHDLAFERIMNVPKRALGPATLNTLHGQARKRGVPLYAAARALVETSELPARARKNLATFLSDCDRWRASLDHLPHAEVAESVLDQSGYMEMWKRDKNPDAQTRLENLKELVRTLEQFPSLSAFLEHVSLVMEAGGDGREDQVTLMTLHAAKGLEFRTVFLPGWEEGLFPHQRALDEGGQAGLEEERRLAYVGITRARENLTISHAQNRRVHALWQVAHPSRFLAEIPKEDSEWAQSIQASTQSSIYGRSFPTDVPHGGGFGAPSFSPGDWVCHAQFGVGVVKYAEGQALTVCFEGGDTKRLMARFVRSYEEGTGV